MNGRRLYFACSKDICHVFVMYEIFGSNFFEHWSNQHIDNQNGRVDAQLTDVTLPTSGKTVHSIFITTDDLAYDIVVMGDPDRVPAAGQLDFDSSRTILLHCPVGLR